MQNKKSVNSVQLRALAIGQSGLEFTYRITVDGVPYNGTLIKQNGNTVTAENGYVTIPRTTTMETTPTPSLALVLVKMW